MSTRSYGKLFTGLLGKLVQSEDTEAGDVIVRYLTSQHANVWPDDRMLENTFLTTPLYRSLTQRRLRLVLEGIEAELRTGMAETADVPCNLTIEHVMPQSWQQCWPLPADVEEPGIAARGKSRHRRDRHGGSRVLHWRAWRWARHVTTGRSSRCG